MQPWSSLCSGASVYHIMWDFVKYFVRYWAKTILNDFVTLKIRLRSPSSNLVSYLSWCFCVPNAVRIHQIFLQILSKNHLTYVAALNGLHYSIWKHGQGHQIWWDFIKYFFRYWVKTILNDIRDPDNKVNITQFELGLCLALVLLCIKFCEDMSNISSNIEQKPSCICCHLKWPS